jgi:hypothetical protein
LLHQFFFLGQVGKVLVFQLETFFQNFHIFNSTICSLSCKVDRATRRRETCCILHWCARHCGRLREFLDNSIEEKGKTRTKCNLNWLFHTLSLSQVCFNKDLSGKEKVVSFVLQLDSTCMCPSNSFCCAEEQRTTTAKLINQTYQRATSSFIYTHANQRLHTPPVFQVECYLKRYQRLHNRRDWCSSTVILLRYSHVVPLHKNVCPARFSVPATT